jgi:hypothetical protein
VNFTSLSLLNSQNLATRISNFHIIPQICTACHEGKQTRERFPKRSNTRSLEPLALIHTDLCGPLPVPSLAKSEYFIPSICRRHLTHPTRGGASGAEHSVNSSYLQLRLRTYLKLGEIRGVLLGSRQLTTPGLDQSVPVSMGLGTQPLQTSRDPFRDLPLLPGCQRLPPNSNRQETPILDDEETEQHWPCSHLQWDP